MYLKGLQSFNWIFWRRIWRIKKILWCVFFFYIIEPKLCQVLI